MLHYDFIREEQYFCSLLMFAILKDPTIANKIFNIPLKENVRFEIYTETNIIRDIWNRLGSTTRLNQININTKREFYLSRLCELLNINFESIKELNCYFSAGGYVNSPSNYKDIDGIEDAKKLRALLNMSQDLLIIFKDTLYFFEAKLESNNKSSQIQNYMILEDLLNSNDSTWAASEKFKGIKKVKYFYIKKTKSKLNVDPDISNKFTIITWEKILTNIMPIMKGINGVYIRDNMKNLGISIV